MKIFTFLLAMIFSLSLSAQNQGFIDVILSLTVVQNQSTNVIQLMLAPIDSVQPISMMVLERSNSDQELVFEPIQTQAFSTAITSGLIEFIDDQVVSSTSVYRIKVIFEDGTFYYTNSVIMIWASVMKCYPTQFQEVVNIDIRQEIPTELTIYDLTGKIYYQTTLAGVAHQTLDTKRFTNGSYYFNLRQGKFSETIKMVKVN